MDDHEFIREYAKKIGITFQQRDIEEILEFAKLDNETDLRWSVWDYLDEYEGISHTRDLDLFPNGDDDNE
tara:strand:- start:1750 stop:1959 length:210 start_codon:yes stop_codon:yes gene_type:complete